jgi:hypothetical protein
MSPRFQGDVAARTYTSAPRSVVVFFAREKAGASPRK